MVAFPFCHVTLSAIKPKNRAYPSELKTIGDHLRKRRFDLGLLQKQVAAQIGVTTCTIMYWETNRVSPAIRFIPLINGFLGYDPQAAESRQAESLAQKLQVQRKLFGLSRKKLAAILGIDQSTLAGWERGEHCPTKKSLKLISTFLRSAADGSN